MHGTTNIKNKKNIKCNNMDLFVQMVKKCTCLCCN